MYNAERVEILQRIERVRLTAESADQATLVPRQQRSYGKKGTSMLKGEQFM